MDTAVISATLGMTLMYASICMSMSEVMCKKSLSESMDNENVQVIVQDIVNVKSMCKSISGSVAESVS